MGVVEASRLQVAVTIWREEAATLPLEGAETSLQMAQAATSLRVGGEIYGLEATSWSEAGVSTYEMEVAAS